MLLVLSLLLLLLLAFQFSQLSNEELFPGIDRAQTFARCSNVLMTNTTVVVVVILCNPAAMSSLHDLL